MILKEMSESSLLTNQIPPFCTQEMLPEVIWVPRTLQSEEATAPCSVVTQQKSYHTTPLLLNNEVLWIA